MTNATINANLDQPQSGTQEQSNHEYNIDLRSASDSRLAQTAGAGNAQNNRNNEINSILLGFELEFIKDEIQLFTNLEKELQSLSTANTNRGSSSKDTTGDTARDTTSDTANPKQTKNTDSGDAGDKAGAGDSSATKSKPTTTDSPPDNTATSKPSASGSAKSSTPENTNSANTTETDSELNKLGIHTGKMIYQNEFNGSQGSQPAPGILDTAHIDAAGSTRQRGSAIDEDGIISTKNSVDDGHGDLQIFPQKQTTYDPIAKQNVDYTKGSMVSTDALDLNLKDHPNGYIIEERAAHPTAPGAKFDALWLETDTWAADPKKGQKQGDTVEYDAAEGDGAGITVHFPSKNAAGQTVDHIGGHVDPKDVNIDDGKFHTYDVVVTPDAKTGKGDITEYIDGKKEFSEDNVIPKDAQVHIQSSLEVSPKWTGQTYTGEGGLNSTGAGKIDYLTVADLQNGF